MGLAFLYLALRDAFLDEDNMSRVVNGFLNKGQSEAQSDYALVQ
jgi:hypothetical protein